jgi:hypothetical protein
MKKTVKEFRIPVSYLICGEVVIKSSTVEGALDYAKKHIDEIDLTDVCNTIYVDDSFEINDDIELVLSINNIKRNNKKEKIMMQEN